ncbi:hypothetical protein Tco_0883678, partial [Tanacetum coccineum]
SKALSPVVDETAPPTRGDRYGEAFPTATSLDSQDLEITQLKARIQTLEDAQKPREGVQEDSLNRGGIDQGEVYMFKGDAEKDSNRSTEKGSESTGDLVNVLSFMGATNILASGGLKEVFPTASLQVPPVSSNVSTAIVTTSEKDPTADVLTTARDITPYTRIPRASRGVVIRSTSPIPVSIPSVGKEDKRKGKEIMTEPEKPAKAKIERDSEIARIHAEEYLRQMIKELDRSNKMINKHMAEYEEAENDLSIEEKTELITEVINYQKDFARIKKYQAQQHMLASKSERRKFYTYVLRSHAGWKTKDFRGMTFDKLEEKFIPVLESIQDFVPMDSKKESESLKRSGILLEKVKAKRLKTNDVSAQEQQESDNQDEIINLQQWAVLVKEETSVNITPSVVKVSICHWKIYKDKLREVYQIFRVGQALKVYPYFESMLKDFNRDDLVTLWKLVKDRFKTELPKSDQEKYSDIYASDSDSDVRKDFARIKKYQAQQQRLASKSERRNFYTSVLKSHVGWKTKDFRGMTFDQLEEKFILVWESIQDFVPMDSKKESESLKRSGILLEKVKAKRLKTSDVLAQEQQESNNQDEIINLHQ